MTRGALGAGMQNGRWQVLALTLFRAALRPLRGRGLMANPVLCRLYEALYWRLAHGEVLTTVQGSRMLLNLRHSALAQRLFMLGVTDRAQTALLRRLLAPGMVFVDVGANVGYYTLLAARLVAPRGRVYAFEPDPACFDLLRRSVEINGYGHVSVFPKALAGTPGVAWLSQPRNKTLQQLTWEQSDGAAIRVGVTTVDAVLRENRWKADVVKMDTEGGEPEVLRGMQETLRRNSALKILTEFNPTALRKLGTDPAAYFRDLEALGFAFYRIPADAGPPTPVGVLGALRECAAGGCVDLLCTR